MRKLSVGMRLAGSFTAVGLLIVVAAGAGLWGMARQGALQHRMDRLVQVRDDMREVQFVAADFAEWQAFVVADANTFGAAYATSATAYNREGEVASQQAVLDVLARTHTVDMTAAERTRFDSLKAAWDEVFAWDSKAMEWLRQDTSASRARALKSINGGAAAAAYRHVLDITEALQKSVSERMVVLRHEAETVELAGRRMVLGALAGALLLAMVLSLAVTRSIVRPLTTVVRALRQLADGNLTVRTGLVGDDALGRIGTAVDETARSLQSTIGALASHADTLSSSATRLSGAAGQITDSAAAASVQSAAVADAAQRVSESVHTVAAGGEEMTASINEISHSTHQAAQVAAAAVATTAETTATVATLGASSAEIGDVVKVITAIAEQTNLLALNATIEAARAGDAGRGFVIVASEIKNLSQETARATDDIHQRVTAIQAATASAVAAIGRTSHVIEQINELQARIAGAVVEQTATTNEMSRNVVAAAAASSDIAANTVGAAQLVADTTTAVTQSRQAANDLAAMSDNLRELVAKFQL